MPHGKCILFLACVEGVSPSHKSQDIDWLQGALFLVHHSEPHDCIGFSGSLAVQNKQYKRFIISYIQFEVKPI
jgi:hypothetical protein